MGRECLLPGSSPRIGTEVVETWPKGLINEDILFVLDVVEKGDAKKVTWLPP